MKHIGRVIGNYEQARPVVIGKDTVYVHNDIQKLNTETTDEESLYSYTETQYKKDEYIELIVKQNEKLNADITDTQIALCEMYETLGGII